jgi:hypothetical protein
VEEVLRGSLVQCFVTLDVVDVQSGRNTVLLGLRNVGNHLAPRINALENNLIPFETVNGKHFQRTTVERAIEAGRWYRLKATLYGRRILGFLDDELLIDFEADSRVAGHVGLWTKADLLCHLAALTIHRGKPGLPPGGPR